MLVAPLIVALASGIAITLLAIAIHVALLVLLTIAVLPAAALLATGALLTGLWVALIRHDRLLFRSALGMGGKGTKPPSRGFLAST